MGQIKYTLQLLKEMRRDLEEVRLMQRTICAGLKGLFNFQKPMIERIACSDEVDREILQLLYEGGGSGMLPRALITVANIFLDRGGGDNVVTKKDLTTAVLLTFCLTTILLTIAPTKSAPSEGEYDPWYDANDDGIINIFDIVMLSSRYGKTGTPINKTELPLSLLDRMSLLEGNINALSQRLNALESNNSVTDVKLAPDAIPSASLCNNILISTTETAAWTDMGDMSLTITLNRSSHLLILFSADARIDRSNQGYSMYARALLDVTIVQSTIVVLVPSTTDSLGGPYKHRHDLAFGISSCTFFVAGVSAGDHTVQMQWRVSGGTGEMTERTLTVIALPA